MEFSPIIEQVALTAIGILIANTDTHIDDAINEAASSLKGRVADSGTLIDDRVLALAAQKLRLFADALDAPASAV